MSKHGWDCVLIIISVSQNSIKIVHVYFVSPEWLKANQICSLANGNHCLKIPLMDVTFSFHADREEEGQNYMIQWNIIGKFKHRAINMRAIANTWWRCACVLYLPSLSHPKPIRHGFHDLVISSTFLREWAFRFNQSSLHSSEKKKLKWTFSRIAHK